MARDADLTPWSLGGGPRSIENLVPPRVCPATLILALATAVVTVPPVAAVTALADSPRLQGALGMPDSHSGSLLVTYYETFLHDRNVDNFRHNVESRYLEGTLAQLAETGDTQTRRASVFALGLVGSYQSNRSVARSLRDNDSTVRKLAENALWAIWFRADSEENNHLLERVSLLIGHHDYQKAITAATRLIERAPRFAEAYNQRAIARYHAGQFQASADDCRLVLENNPYHIGALAGLAKCLLRLDRRTEAIEALKRSARLQPFNTELKSVITVLEAGQ